MHKQQAEQTMDKVIKNEQYARHVIWQQTQNKKSLINYSASFFL